MFKSTQNFLNYRKQCFENLNSLNSLNKYPANYKKFLKNNYKKYFILYFSNYKSYFYKRNNFLFFLQNNFFSIMIFFKISNLLNNLFDNVFFSYLQKRYLVYIVKASDNGIYIYLNNLNILKEILNLFRIIQSKISNVIDLKEINQVSIKSKNLIISKKIKFINKFILNINTYILVSLVISFIKNIFLIKYIFNILLSNLNYLINILLLKIFILLKLKLYK